jgi:hypothetical protein
VAVLGFADQDIINKARRCGLVAVEAEDIRHHQRVNQDLVKRRRKVYLLPHLADLTNVVGMLGIRPSTLNNPFIMASFDGHCPYILPSWALILLCRCVQLTIHTVV